MNTLFPLPLLVPYALFCFFAFMQKRHMSRFQGASQAFLFILSLFVMATTLTHIGLLVYFGFQTHWWAPFLLFVIGTVASMILAFTVRIPDFILSLAGFLIVPVTLWFTWESIASISHR